MYFLDLGDFQIVGSSPEILVAPAGRRRSPCARSPARARAAPREEEDLALKQELLADPKEIAEHLMLIDLGRNDVGRVAQTGTVRYGERMVIERYSTSCTSSPTSPAACAKACRAIDVLRATLPAGTLSRRAEDPRDGDHRRTRTGQARHLRRRGGLPLVERQHGHGHRDPHRGDQGRRLHVQAGAGIVADSVPALEWEETLNKARARHHVPRGPMR
jgi:anthranilate synthase component 1